MEVGEEAYLLRIFIGEADKHEGKLLYEWIVRQARDHRLAGATVVRGIMGYGANSHSIQTFKIERLSEDLPIVVEIIDSRDTLEAFLPVIDGAMDAGLVTLEKVQVRIYRSAKR